MIGPLSVDRHGSSCHFFSSLNTTSSRAHLTLFPFNGCKTVRPLPPSSLTLGSFSQSKSLEVADLKEVCSRANIPTTTRSTKADLITKILASQPAIDAYNAKYQQNENAALPSKPAPPEECADVTLLSSHLLSYTSP